MVLEKTLESPLDSKEIQPVHPKGNQSWIFIGRTDVEAETPILWPPDVKSWLIWKDPDTGKDWGQEEKGMTEDEMAGWHHWLMDMSLGRLWDLVMHREAWHAAFMDLQRVWHDWATEMNWTEIFGEIPCVYEWQYWLLWWCYIFKGSTYVQYDKLLGNIYQNHNKLPFHSQKNDH